MLVDELLALFFTAVETIAGPVPTQREVDDKHVWAKLLVKLTAVRDEDGSRRAPLVGSDFASVVTDVCGDVLVITSPEPEAARMIRTINSGKVGWYSPDLDVFVRALSGIPAIA